MTPPILFVRHGETDWNVEGRLQGLRDIPLNARGQRQAVAAGRRVAAFFAANNRAATATHYVSSPLTRARDTMGAVRTVLALPPDGHALDDRLREFSFGAWEGLTWAEVKAKDRASHRARKADRWGFVPPGGESYAMLADRVAGWLGTLEGRTVAVSHGGVARALMVLVGGLSTHAAPVTEVPQGRVIHFEAGRMTWL